MRNGKVARVFCCALAALLALLLTACAAREDGGATPAPPSAAKTPKLPRGLKRDENGIPLLSVYRTEQGAAETMDIETYVQGVVAGEMNPDWPDAALRAQAILARTFTLKFLSEKDSKYPDADISDDVKEAQAFSAEVSDGVRNAVAATRGFVLSAGGELPYAWFHSHSGGMTALAKEGLGYADAEPEYTLVTRGQENGSAPDSAAEWTAAFSKSEVVRAAQTAGARVTDAESVSVLRRGDSGRALALDIGGTEVDAVALRTALGGEKMRSTLLTSLRVSGDQVLMAGKGYGHGVGMSQWGAYALAKNGLDTADIIATYYRGVDIVRLWGDEAGGAGEELTGVR